MQRLKTTLMLAALLYASCSMGATAQEEDIKQRVQAHFGSRVQVSSVRATPYNGLYEVYANGEILYTNKTLDYLFVGSIVNATTSQNMTKARLDELTRITFSDLPLQLAVKRVKGNGKRIIAIFEDPNCIYCKRFHQNALNDIDNVTVYSFLYNILSDDSFAKSRNIWCSGIRYKALDEWMVTGKPALSAAADCATPNDQVLALGKKLRVQATPSVFFSDGSRIAGAMDRNALEAKLASIKMP